MALPTLHRTLRACGQYHGLDANQIDGLHTRLDLTEDQFASVQLYCWAADILTTHNRLAIGLHVGIGSEAVSTAITAIEKSRDASPDMGLRHDELLLEIHAEAEALARLGLQGVDEDDPSLVAARLNGPARAAYGVSLSQLRVLARGFVGLTLDLQAAAVQIDRLQKALAQMRQTSHNAQITAAAKIAAAEAAVECAIYTPGERHARHILAKLKQELAHV